jgi:hypothetical protein
VAFFVTHTFGPILTPLRRGAVATLAALVLFVALPLADAAPLTAYRLPLNATDRYQHDPGVKHCVGKTKDGSPCRNLPQPGGAYCKLHEP